MSETCELTAAGVLRLPSGRFVRGRGLLRALPDGPTPAFALYLLGRQPPAVAWESRWVRWPDFRLPSDRRDAREALVQAWGRAPTERVEVACASTTAVAPWRHCRSAGSSPASARLEAPHFPGALLPSPA